MSHTSSGRVYVISIWADRKDATCADHAYGAPVINFLRTHPCQGLRRLLATTTVNGRRVGFAESRIGFYGMTAMAAYQAAGSFRTLVTQDGTGNIVDLLREGYSLPSGPQAVPASSAFAVQSQDAGVTVDELWYLDGPTLSNDPLLEQLSQEIYLRFE